MTSGGDKHEERRRDERRKVILAATIVVYGRCLPCQVRDLSASGVKVRIDKPLAPGTPVHLDLPRHDRFPAVVVWAKDGMMGLAFPEGPGFALARFGDAAVRLGLLCDDQDD